MPKIALGPILYVWLGETMSVYRMAIAISVIVTILMIYDGMSAVDARKVLLRRTFGASRWQVLRYVVIVDEFLSSNAGLGYLIVHGSQVFQMDMVIGSIVLLLLIRCCAAPEDQVHSGIDPGDRQDFLGVITTRNR